jgi:hypothetical protein
VYSNGTIICSIVTNDATLVHLRHATPTQF